MKEKLKLSFKEQNNVLGSAVLVCFLQITLGCVLIANIQIESFTMPMNVITIGARFICSILMHLQVEGDVIQGQKMMKFAVNHPKQFDDPKIAWFVGFMQFITSLMSEICCLFYIATIHDTLEVIIKFMAIAKISKVSELYYDSIPSDNKLKTKKKSSKSNLQLDQDEDHDHDTDSEKENQAEEE
jgi:hypothetical protein